MGSGCGEEVEDEEVPLTGAVRESDRKNVGTGDPHTLSCYNP